MKLFVSTCMPVNIYKQPLNLHVEFEIVSNLWFIQITYDLHQKHVLHGGKGGGRCIIGTTDWWCIWPLKIFCMVWITYYHPALVQELPYIANYLVPTRTWDTKIQTEIKSTISFCYKIRRILLPPNISSLHSPFYCGCKHMALEELHHYVKFSH